MTELLRPDVSCQMGTGIRMAVGVTIETSDAAAWTHGAAVLCLIELLLRERCDKQSQALKLFRIQHDVEQFIIVIEGHELTQGYVTEIGPSCQVHGGWEFR